MSKFDLIDDLIAKAKELPTFDGKLLDALIGRATLVVRNVFGPNSSYLDEIRGVSFIPFVEGETPLEVKVQSWERSKQELLNLFQTMREDLEISSHLYNSNEDADQKIDTKQSEAIDIFGDLVSYFAALAYPDPNPSKTTAQLTRAREAIKKRFGIDSEYFTQVQGIRFHHGRARKSNKPIYFNTSKSKLMGVLDRILDDLRLSPSAPNAPSDVVETRPIFGKPLPFLSSQWAQVFVLMPFEEKLKAVYGQHILEVTNKLGLSCKRGDDFFSAASIINEIWSAIFHARVCIADCTGRNPNVFYEIGIAHTIGRPCILIAQSPEDIPFDVRHIRSIIYKHTDEGMNQFEQTLEKTLRSILQIPT